jgi:hypothetical protein
MKTKLLQIALLLSFFVFFENKDNSIQQEPYVTSAKITFMTPSEPGGDDKDDDTKITISIFNIYGYQCASRYYTDKVQFKDDGSSHDVRLDLSTAPPVYKSAITSLQKMNIGIIANGADNWEFVPTVIFNFSDGTVKVFNFQKTKLRSNGHTGEELHPL